MLFIIISYGEKKSVKWLQMCDISGQKLSSLSGNLEKECTAKKNNNLYFNISAK
jgi:hypothetical protein